MARKQLPYLNQIDYHREQILNGMLLCVDPSVGSSSSMPGWALYSAGELLDSGTFDITVSKPLNERLQELSHECHTLWYTRCTTGDWDASGTILVIEHITKFGARSMDSLLKGVGAILAAVPCKVAIEIPPSAWHRLEPPGYYKTDEQDAIALGYYAIQKAKGVPDNETEQDRVRKRKKSNARSSVAKLRTLRAKRVRRTSKASTKTSAGRSPKATRKKLAGNRRVRSKPTSRRR